MKTLEVEFNIDCPFYFYEEYQFSEYTVDWVSKCTILDDYCCGLGYDECPLKDNIIIVKRKK